MDLLISVALAVLGSSVISTLITILAERWRPDNNATAFTAWNDEAQLLQTLEAGADDSEYSESTQQRYKALAIAGNVQFGKASAARLIPNDGISGPLKWIGLMLLLVFFAPITLYYFLAGEDMPGLFSESEPGFFKWYWLSLSVLLFVAVMGAFLDSKYRNILRRWVSETLRARQAGASDRSGLSQLKHIIKPGDTGGKVKFTWLAKRVLTDNVRDKFSQFMESNAR